MPQVNEFSWLNCYFKFNIFIIMIFLSFSFFIPLMKNNNKFFPLKKFFFCLTI